MNSLSRRALMTTMVATSATAVAPWLHGCATAPDGASTVAMPALLPAPELAALAPLAPREFRGAWVATVANIDWPSRKGLSTEAQQAEMHTLLDRALALNLNAIILQVRTSADALYASELEPWSEYLTGIQGQAPVPYYDPLALWISEAHARGLELHAWFNPFRARQGDAKSVQSPQHLSQTRPEWVKSYGNQLWIDPGEPAAADHSLAVLMDVLRRYDVDGIHIDDYFYPYPVTVGEGSKTELDFPDQPAWTRYVEGGGTLARDDWRRSNVDTLIERIHQGIRQTKPWVRFGISPFGLGRPDLRPPGIQGFSQYHKLYADVERWLQEGWLDYLAPQLYWPRDQKEQAFGPLLDYWHRQNPKGRHVWAGLYTSRVAAAVDTSPRPGWSPQEITGQIDAVRARAPDSGHLHFSMVALLQNRQGLADALLAGPYAQPALVPATPWLEPVADVLAPRVALVQRTGAGFSLQLTTPVGGSTPVLWAVWLRYADRWELHVLAHPQRIFPTSRPGVPERPLNAIVVSAIDRVGRESPRLGFGMGTKDQVPKRLPDLMERTQAPTQ